MDESPKPRPFPKPHPPKAQEAPKPQPPKIGKKPRKPPIDEHLMHRPFQNNDGLRALQKENPGQKPRYKNNRRRYTKKTGEN